MKAQYPENRFICDRMAGSLCRYLRLMGYDTRDANDLPAGDRKEDTRILQMARQEERIVLTRDGEFSRRDPCMVYYLSSEKLEEQLRELISAHLIAPELRLSRCSVCNTPLTLITIEDLIHLNEGVILPELSADNTPAFWCHTCRKGYWEGSHTRNMRVMMRRISRSKGE